MNNNPQPEAPRINSADLLRSAETLMQVLAPGYHLKENLRETPRRIAQAYMQLLTPEPFTPTTFPNDGGYDEMVIIKNLPFISLCEHHLLPFMGTATIGYLPGERILGLSKFSRVVEQHARALQVQERLTVQIGDWLNEKLSPIGIGVILQARHLCMEIRGVKTVGAFTTTSALYGVFKNDTSARSEFLKLSR